MPDKKPSQQHIKTGWSSYIITPEGEKRKPYIEANTADDAMKKIYLVFGKKTEIKSLNNMGTVVEAIS